MSHTERFERPRFSAKFRGAAVWALAILLIGVAFFHLHRFYSRKFHLATGNAEWLWADHKLSSGKEIVFFAARDFDLPAGRAPVRVKVAADPEYTLFFNGREIGGGRARPAATIDVYDVTTLAREHDNRIVVALRSARGVGGFLASVDAGAQIENLVYTDESWTIHRRWTASLLTSSASGERPRSFGRPPWGKWDFPQVRRREAFPPATRVVEPVATRQFNAILPMIRVVSGVAIDSGEPAIAVAYDFGRVEGRGRIHVSAGKSRVVKVRFANHETELSEQGEIVPFVVAQDEAVVVDPEIRRFRYLVIYDEPGASCSVLSS